MSTFLEEVMKAGVVKEQSLMSETTFFNEKEYVHTGYPIIDVAFSAKLDGGFSPGVTLIAGESKSFKTMLMLLCLAKFQEEFEDGIALLYDTEYGITPEYLKTNNIDPSRVIHIPVDDLEQLKFDISKRLEVITKKHKVFIGVDSLGMIASKKEVEDAINEKSVADMTRAKANKGLFRLITSKMTKKGIYFFAIQHTYNEIGLYPKAIVSGGSGQIYAANTIFIITKAQVKGDDGLSGFRFTLNIEKSRYVREKSKLPFIATFEDGILKWSAIFDLAVEAGFIEKVSQGWWARVDPESGEVEEGKFREKAILEDDEFFEKLIANETFKTFVNKKYSFGA